MISYIRKKIEIRNKKKDFWIERTTRGFVFWNKGVRYPPRKKISISLPVIRLYKVLYKKYRLDKNLYETKISILGINHYKYSIRERNIVKVHRRLFKYAAPNYFKW